MALVLAVENLPVGAKVRVAGTVPLYATVHDTGSGTVAPLSNTLFVDLGTGVPLSEQDGSIGKPFSTMAGAFARAALLGGATLYATPGNYAVASPLTASVPIVLVCWTPSSAGALFTLSGAVNVFPSQIDEVTVDGAQTFEMSGFFCSTITLGNGAILILANGSSAGSITNAAGGATVYGFDSNLPATSCFNLFARNVFFSGGPTVITTGNLCELYGCRFGAAATINPAGGDLKMDPATFYDVLTLPMVIAGGVVPQVFGQTPQTRFWTADDGDPINSFARLEDWSYGNPNTELLNQLIMRGTGIVAGLFAKEKAGNAAADQTFTLRKNGVNTAMTVTIATGTSFAAATGAAAAPIPYADQDRLGILNATAIGAAGVVDIGLQIYSTSPPA